METAEDDDLDWGYGPLAAAHSQGRSLVAAAPAADHVADAPRPARAVEQHGALARAASVRATGGPRRQTQRRKKEKKAGIKASELLLRRPDQEEVTPVHDLNRSAVRATSGSQVARQPFGAVHTGHRRRAGGRARSRAVATDTSGDNSNSRHSGDLVAISTPAEGFTTLTEEQLAVVREVFEHVDSGNKGWLCRDDVQQIVRTLNTLDVSQRKRVDSRHVRGSIGAGSLSKSQALETTRIVSLGAAADREQRKQDSAREPTSPTPDGDEDSGRSPEKGTRDARWASCSATTRTEEEMEQQITEAAQERVREGRRQRRRAEREEAATVELLKVLMPPDSLQLQRAGGPGAESPVRLAFSDFSKAVDGAMLRTSIEPDGRVVGGRRQHGSTATGASSREHGFSPGELYCRKVVTHWRHARGLSDDRSHLGASNSAVHACETGERIGPDSYAAMLELLVPLSVRETSEVLEDEFLE